MNLETICEKVTETAKKAGNLIRNERINFSLDQVQSKGLHDFVTNIDKASEEFIYKRLMDIIPEAGFLAEENTHFIKGETYNWIVDPLDGTTNFIHGLYPYAVSIALTRNSELVLGVIYEIGADEMFYAWENSGAFCNEKRIEVSLKNSLKDSLIATGFPYSDFSNMSSFLKSLEFFMENSHGLRRLGSAAVDLAYLARGQFEGFYEYNLSPWDVAAGAIIVQQAGGKICDFSGGSNYVFGNEIIAANSGIFDEFYQTINHIMLHM